MRLLLLLACCLSFSHGTGMSKKGRDTIRIYGQRAFSPSSTAGGEAKILTKEKSHRKLKNSHYQGVESVQTANNKYTMSKNDVISRESRKNLRNNQHNIVKISKSLNELGESYSYKMQYNSVANANDHLGIGGDRANYDKYFLPEKPDPELKGICHFPLEKYDTNSHLDPHGYSNRRDKFQCSARCICQWVDTRQTPEKVVAYCNGKAVSIPQDLPKVTKRIEMSGNNMSKLNLHPIFLYPYLESFIARNSYIDTIFSPSTTMTSTSLQVLDLSYNRIQTFDFDGFTNLIVLRLTSNNIYQVKKSFFCGLGRLQFLSLSQNNILEIDSNSFQNIPNLEVLDLSVNSRLGYHSFSSELFKEVKNLKVLNIQNCSNGATEYPDEAIGELQQLVELNIDALAFPAEFKSQFATLKKLENLRFGPHADCRMTKMSESFFQYVPNITCLFFHSCNMTINPDAYGSFKQLKALTIEKIPRMNIDTAFRHLEGFKTKSLEYIGFKNLKNRNWPCIWLWEKQGKSMNGFTNMTVINLSENLLSLLADSFIKTIPLTTKKLILRKNKFDLINTLWTRLTGLTKLSYLDVSMQNWEGHRLFYAGWWNNNTRVIKYTKELNERALITSHTDRLANKFENDVVMQIPQNLKTVKASMYHSFGTILLTNKIGNNSLKNLNFSQSGLIEWGKGRLPKYVEIVDLSSNSATHIDKDFFHPNNSLRELHLQINFLGDFIADTNTTIFEYLANLEYLDLTTNVIYAIPYGFFKGLIHVKAISLSNNRLETLNVSFENMPNLKFLDLHKNSLSWISKASRDQMDKLEGLVVDLHYNSFQCNCDSIDLLRWMVMTRVYFLNIKLYECHDLDNRPVFLGSRKEIKLKVDYLRRHCTSSGYLIIAGVGIGVVFVFLCMSGFAYRKRWLVKYKLHVLCAKKFGYKPKNQSNHADSYHLFDAFLLYVDADQCFAIRCSKELEKKRHHKICIRDRDIIPGTIEMASIISFIQNSRFTLVVVTDNFVEEMNNNFRDSPMIKHAIQMAVMEEYCTSRKTIHLMMCSSSENANYPHYLLKVFRDQHVTSFPSSNDEQIVSISLINTFWDRISDVIGHTKEDDEDTNGWNFNSYMLEDD